MFPKMNKGQSASTDFWFCDYCRELVITGHDHNCPTDRAVHVRIAVALERIAELLEKQHKSRNLRIDYKPVEDASNPKL